LATVVGDTKAEVPHRIAAATAVLPYLYPRIKPERFITEPFELGAARTVAEASEQIILINQLIAAGKMDMNDGAVLVTNLRHFVDILTGVELEARLRTVINELRSADVTQPDVIIPPHTINGNGQAYEEAAP
jgi:hypothetical protein